MNTVRFIECLLLIIIGEFFNGLNCQLECLPFVQPKSPGILRTLFTPKKEKIPEEEIKIYVFTRLNQNCLQEITTASLNESYFNTKWQTRILIHGWMNSVFDEYTKLIKDAYLTKGDYNVIVVDWGGLAQDSNYDLTSQYVEAVGKIVADFAQSLHTEQHVPYNDMYLIGHSLGAHIAGVAGNLVPDKFNTIFALDPAEPNFKETQGGSRVSTSSAKYVESIQTNIELLGIKYPVGHASFFPNFGGTQRGCSYLGRCSHSRAYIYFAESINSNVGFWGKQCNSMDEIRIRHCYGNVNVQVMGGEPSTPKSGVYYVPTNWREPFAKGTNTMELQH